MKQSKRMRLAAQGWTVGSVQDFLNLSDAEAALVEVRLALSRSLKVWRTKRGLSQMQLAKQLKSSQSRVAKMEAGDASVSVDLLLRSLFVVGVRPRMLARTIEQLEHRVTIGHENSRRLRGPRGDCERPDQRRDTSVMRVRQVAIEEL